MATPRHPRAPRSPSAPARDDWRFDERVWTRIAADQWFHGRSFRDVLEDAARRGDRIAVDVASHRVVGTVIDVGDEVLRVDTGLRIVDVSTRGGAVPIVALVESFACGGCRPRRALGSWRATLLAAEVSHAELQLGLTAGTVISGCIVVARDHVVVTSGIDEMYVPIGGVVYVGMQPGSVAEGRS